MTTDFKLNSPHAPTGDQPQAIAEITAAFRKPENRHHTLLGVTGSGKTFTMANVIANLNRPTLIIAHNKTLAAQLFSEFKDLFPDNAVEFFISYYDYYQPEAYVPGTDTYIAKDSSINDDIDKMRHSATRSLFERRDTIIVASVSCIYGLGSPDAYSHNKVALQKGLEISRNELLGQLIDIQYSRNDTYLKRGCFRVRGDTIHILPSHKREEAIRVEMFGDEIDRISVVDALTGKLIRDVDQLSLYPNSHYVTDRRDKQKIVQEILHDLGVRLRELKAENKLVEYQRLEQRTMQDVETFEQLGFCPGVENYSRYLTGLPTGHPPPTLIDYFPKDFLTIIDESHISVPQIGGMYRGDRSRKQVLVDFGFRLPSALDNRPLNFDEFQGRIHQTLYVSATPGPFELQASAGKVSQQLIRPTGLIDPPIKVRPAQNQIDHLLEAIQETIKNEGRVLVTTLTKRMAEDITDYYRDLGIKIKYLHSDIDSLERVQLLRELRSGDFHVLVGINLLREGLDLPEVKLVAILDADKEGFLRSRPSLIQTVGRAARNAEGRVIFYADQITESMQQCLDETERRREVQKAYNEEHGITPTTIQKELPRDLREIYGLEAKEEGFGGGELTFEKLQELGVGSVQELDRVIRRKTKDMKKHAADLEFEKAAQLRDEIAGLRDMLMQLGDSG